MKIEEINSEDGAFDVSKYVLDTSKEYALYSIHNRGIPYIGDGLKNGQRKALWLMRNRSEKVKVISLAGEMIQSNLYLHGDMAAADSISKLAAPYLNNNTFLSGVGQFGSKTNPYGIGSPRYVYVKKNKFTENVLLADLNLVSMKENYDGSTMEPVSFLPLVPLVLLNGISGIATGWSTEILPRKFEDLKKAVVTVLEGKKLEKLIPSYTFVEGATKNISGNSWEFYGNIKKVDASTIKVIELPPDMKLETFREKLDDLEEKKIIRSYIDRSTKLIDITIKLGRGEAETRTEEEWLNFFELRTRKTERIVVIDWDFQTVRQYATAEEVVQDFVKWRFETYILRYNELLKTTKNDLEYWQMVLKCFDGKLPNKIVDMKNKKELVIEISKLTGSKNAGNIEKICSYPTYRWTEDFYADTKKKIAEIEKEILTIQDLIDNPKKIKSIFIEEVKGLKE